MMQRIVLLVLLALSSCDSSAPAIRQRDLSDSSSYSSSSSSSSSSSGLSFWGYLLQLLHHCPPGQHYKDGKCKKPSHHHSSSHSSGGGGSGGSGYNYTDDTTLYADSWGTDGWSDDAWGSDGHTTAYASRQAQSGSGMSVWPFAIGALVASVIGAAFVIIRRKQRAQLGGSNNAFSSFFSWKKQGALNDDFHNDEPNFIEISDAKNKYKSPKNLVMNKI
eukprot:CCRYP_021188-RA/>CCRYP_021188-RA protein AED:0.10 eAED:0.10 QI:213/1/1/1/1/1/2/412/218